jgi:heme-degrading monooxygenase HmoA
MPTTIISTEDEVMTLINVFTVKPADQEELIDVLVEATSVMRQIPGFVSANLHRSRDGQRVVNYVQWRTVQHFQAMLEDPRATPHMQRAAELGTYDPIICDVTYTGHA